MTRMKQPQQQISNLANIVQQDTTLKPEYKTLFTEMSKDFEQDFQANLFLSSIELSEKYRYGIDMWQKYITHPTIAKYLASFAHEVILKKTDADIMSGSGVRDAVAVKKELLKNVRGQDNFEFVIMLVPDEEPRIYGSSDPTGEN